MCAIGMPVSGPAVAGGDRRVGGARVGERALRVDGDERVELRVEARDAVERRSRQLDAGHALRAKRRRKLGDGRGDHHAGFATR